MRVKYLEKHQMEARFGNKFATTYIRMDSRQKAKLRKHVDKVRMDIIQAYSADPVNNEWIQHPMKDFRDHKGKPKYSVIDIVEDVYQQITNGRDLTEAMLGRWQRLLGDTEWCIELEDDKLEEPADLPWDPFNG